MIKNVFSPLLVAAFIFLAFFSNFAWSADSDKPAPSQLPHVTPEMLSAGFWIAQHPSPDKTVMDEKQIQSFNGRIQNDLKLTKDIFSVLDSFHSESLMDTLKKNIEDFENGYFTLQGVRNDADFIDQAKKNMYLSGVVLGIAPRYGLVTHYAHQRFFPTEEGLYAQKGDIDFDELQNSALDVGTAVAVVHQSMDKKWYYVLSSLSDGWVKTDHIALGDAQQVKAYVQAQDFIVIKSSKADIYLDASMTMFYGFARMGVKYPLLEDNDEQWIIQLPMKSKEGKLQLTKGYISKVQAHHGYLPYTARTVLTQAFLMLDKPYGWGDMYGQQDCSRFLQMVYATVGLELPRDSKNQAQVGDLIFSFDEKTPQPEKLEQLKNVTGAVSVLSLKGHIMMYLGMVNGIPFAMHESSGYSKNKGDDQVKYVLNRVVVSDLSLGESSTKGSLLRRLLKVIGMYSHAD